MPFLSVEGKVSIQFVGQIYVSGISIEAAMQKIKRRWLRSIVLSAQGQSQVTVSLSRIRTIRGLSSVVNNLGITHIVIGNSL
jgi:protein involved in polysaccharide export with SLBB domain